MAFGIMESTPCTAVFYGSVVSGEANAFGLSDWEGLTDGPLKDLLTGIYIKNGVQDREAFIAAAMKAGFKYVNMSPTGPYATPQGLQYTSVGLVGEGIELEVGPIGSVYVVLLVPEEYAGLHLSVFHSIAK